MSKYAYLGLFFTLLVVMIGGLQINHSSNTHNMSEIDVGLSTATIGDMRVSDGETYGMPAKDVVAEITAQVAEKQANHGKDVVVSYKFYDKNGSLMNYATTLSGNKVINSVQYKVELYKSGDVDGAGNAISGAKPESSTEYRISLNKEG